MLQETSWHDQVCSKNKAQAPPTANFLLAADCKLITAYFLFNESDADRALQPVR